MDWNWFFSAVAQSTAALISIFSAFIISKIINNQKDFSKNNKLFIDYENKSIRLQDSGDYNKIPHHNEIMRNTISIEKKNLDSEINFHINNIKNFIDIVSSNPESSKLISFSIIAVFLLFWVGVFYPLCFLPYCDNISLRSIFRFSDLIYSSRSFILLIIALIFSIVLIVFFIINMTLKYDKKRINNLKKYTNNAFYSKQSR